MNILHRLNLTLAMIAMSLAASATAMAIGVSKDEYKMNKEGIASDYKIAIAKCNSLATRPKDLCISRAKRNESISLADLEARLKPTEENRYNAAIVRANADYDMAEEKCGPLNGNRRDVCSKEAKAVQAAAIADVNMRRETSKANKEANQESADTRAKRSKRVSEAKTDAREDARDADFSLAKERCAASTGDAKDRCLVEAKAQYEHR